MRLCARTKEYEILTSPPDYIPDRLNLRHMASYTSSPSVSAWSTLSPVIGYCSAAGQSEDLRLAISLRVDRRVDYYIYNILFPIYLIVSMGPVSFLVSPEEVGERMGICLALLLTQITFKFIISGETPKTSTMTLLDKFVILSYLYIVAIVLQTVFLFVACDEEYWNTLNAISFIAYLGSWTLINYWVVVTGNNGGFSIPWIEMKDEAAGGTPVILVDDDDIHLDPEKLKTD